MGWLMGTIQVDTLVAQSFAKLTLGLVFVGGHFFLYYASSVLNRLI